jgi:hypothetical protein
VASMKLFARGLDRRHFDRCPPCCTQFRQQKKHNALILVAAARGFLEDVSPKTQGPPAGVSSLQPARARRHLTTAPTTVPCRSRPS